MSNYMAMTDMEKSTSTKYENDCNLTAETSCDEEILTDHECDEDEEEDCENVSLAGVMTCGFLALGMRLVYGLVN